MYKRWRRRKQLMVHPIASTTKSNSMKSGKRNSVDELADDSVPRVPRNGARIKVCFAGACFADKEMESAEHRLSKVSGGQDTTSFPGYEFAGEVEELGSEVQLSKILPGDRVVIYPREAESFSRGFAQFVTVRNVNDLVKIPENVPMAVGAILPTEALHAFVAALRAKKCIQAKLDDRPSDQMVHLLIVGAGALGLWTLSIAKHFLDDIMQQVHIAIADKNMNQLMMAKEHGGFDIIHWNDAIYEEHILQRTRDVCSGGVDIAIDYVSSFRTTSRIAKVLNEDGVILVGGNSQDTVTLNLGSLSAKNQCIVGVERGTVEQLETLVDLIASEKVKPPFYTVYPVKEADRVFDLLSNSKIIGRAIFEIPSTSQNLEREKSTSTVADSQ